MDSTPLATLTDPMERKEDRYRRLEAAYDLLVDLVFDLTSDAYGTDAAQDARAASHVMSAIRDVLAACDCYYHDVIRR